MKVASYGYDAYGALTDSQVQPGLKNPWLFTGRELDGDSGLQYNRARYYLAGVGSWNREDPANLRGSWQANYQTRIDLREIVQSIFIYSPETDAALRSIRPCGGFSHDKSQICSNATSQVVSHQGIRSGIMTSFSGFSSSCQWCSCTT